MSRVKMEMFESENDLISTLEKYDQLIRDCVAERISFDEFLEEYDSFYVYYALDGHESDQEEKDVLQRFENRIAVHREVWEQIIGGGLCSDEDAQKEAYMLAGRFGSDEAINRLKEVSKKFLLNSPH